VKTLASAARRATSCGAITRMKRKIDSALGRAIYGKRLGTVEPVFAHITRMLGLNRFTLRGKHKVNTQWLLYCLVHNIGKIHRYAPGVYPVRRTCSQLKAIGATACRATPHGEE